MERNSPATWIRAVSIPQKNISSVHIAVVALAVILAVAAIVTYVSRFTYHLGPRAAETGHDPAARIYTCPRPCFSLFPLWEEYTKAFSRSNSRAGSSLTPRKSPCGSRQLAIRVHRRKTLEIKNRK